MDYCDHGRDIRNVCEECNKEDALNKQPAHWDEHVNWEKLEDALGELEDGATVARAIVNGAVTQAKMKLLCDALHDMPTNIAKALLLAAELPGYEAKVRPARPAARAHDALGITERANMLVKEAEAAVPPEREIDVRDQFTKTEGLREVVDGVTGQVICVTRVEPAPMLFFERKPEPEPVVRLSVDFDHCAHSTLLEQDGAPACAKFSGPMCDGCPRDRS